MSLVTSRTELPVNPFHVTQSSGGLTRGLYFLKWGSYSGVKLRPESSLMSICEVLTLIDNLGKEDTKLFNKQFKVSWGYPTVECKTSILTEKRMIKRSFPYHVLEVIS